MPLQRKKYSKEFKNEAAKLITVYGLSQVEAAKELNISDKNINRWVAELKLGTKPNNKVMNTDPKSIDQELIALLKEIKRLRHEQESLKKARSCAGRKINKNNYNNFLIE